MDIWFQTSSVETFSTNDFNLQEGKFSLSSLRKYILLDDEPEERSAYDIKSKEDLILVKEETFFFDSVGITILLPTGD